MTEPNRPTIRIATSDDAAELVRMNALFNGLEDSVEQFAERMGSAAMADIPIIMEMDGKAVGFACLRLVPSLFLPEPHAELSELFVAESYRMRGLARELVAFAENLALQRGARELHVLVGLRNQTAQIVYYRLGYLNRALALNKRIA